MFTFIKNWAVAMLHFLIEHHEKDVLKKKSISESYLWQRRWQNGLTKQAFFGTCKSANLPFGT